MAKALCGTQEMDFSVLECILRLLAIVKEESLRVGVPLHSTDIQHLAWPPILLFF